MADTPTRTRTITDDYGKPHQYMLVCFPALSGITIGQQLIDLMGASLRVHDGVAGAVQGFAAGMLKAGNEKLILELLKYVSRNGEKVAEQAVFERVYMANYGELLRALEFVVEENFAGFSSAAGEVLGRRLVSLLAPKAGSPLSWLTDLLTGFSGPSSVEGSAAGPKSADSGPSTKSSTD
jgi:hypothetical protein